MGRSFLKLGNILICSIYLYSPAMLNPWAVMRAIECSRAVGWWIPSHEDGNTFMDFSKLELLFFTVSTTMTYQPEIYNLDLEKRPITLNNELVHVGRTSFKYNTDVTFPGYVKPLVHTKTGFVFCDKDSRKPKPPDAWWQEKFLPLLRDNETPLRLPKPEIPSEGDIIENQIRILPSDIDPYMHMNWSCYIKYCMDMYTIHHVNLHGYTKHGDPFPNVKSVQVNYRGEVSLGDVIDMKWWKTGANVNEYSFVFLKGEQIVCDCKLEFFSHIHK